jgi:uncharacterized protein YcbX
VNGRLAALYRHPVKGFTPERLDRVRLAAGAHFPCDRMYAVEDGPCGFDPEAPVHIAKQRFTVLAKIAEVAKARTHYDEATAVLSVEAEGRDPLAACLAEVAGRDAFAAWLTGFLGANATGPLSVLVAPQGHRFMDHPRGFVSIVNLASVRDLAARIGRPVDPLRFRANLYVEGWPAWSENAADGGVVRMGAGEARVLKPITRCVAAHVDPATGERDMDVVKALFDHYGHMLCGIYVEVVDGCELAPGDPVELAA